MVSTAKKRVKKAYMSSQKLTVPTADNSHK